MRTRIVAVVGIALAVPACAPFKRTPDARFFVLRPLVEPPAAQPSTAGGGLVGVLPVRVPGYLDRPQLVTEMGADQVRVDEYARWAEPFPAAVTRTVAENLAILLPEDRVVRYPWPAGESTRCRVSVELRVLAAQGDGSVRLEGRWALLPDREERPLALRPVGLRRGPLPIGPRGVEPAAGVEAISELLADLSREIASGVRALPTDEEQPTGKARPTGRE
jgi:uncharacterized lipoprotein YmbA